MYNREWERFGEEIKRSVQDAVNTGDFSRLNQTITDTVNGAADMLNHTVNDAADTIRNVTGKANYGRGNRKGRNRTGENRTGQDFTGKGYTEGSYTYTEKTDTGESRTHGYHYEYGENRAQGYHYEYGGNRAQAKDMPIRTKNSPALFKSVIPAKIGGGLLSCIGAIYTLFCVAMVLFGSFELMGGSADTGTAAVLVLFSLFGIGSIAMLAIGTGKLGSVKRFQSYIRELSGREYCDIKQLTAAVGKSAEYVVKDLKKMIRRGWFVQGHLDKQGRCLMVSHAAYHQYTELLESTERQKEEQQRAEEEQKKAAQAQSEEEAQKAKFSPEVRQVLETGDEYVRKIHACNDAIPGEEISAKIARIEMLVDKIFDRVEKSPESVSDLRRMMDYYLPTTVKLLEAYEELDAQPVQGENIISSKREIEKTLDTLNVAFEKLLDDMFQDTAWDVSSDISVLQTMLAQEGLTEDGLKK